MISSGTDQPVSKKKLNDARALDHSLRLQDSDDEPEISEEQLVANAEGKVYNCDFRRGTEGFESTLELSIRQWHEPRSPALRKRLPPAPEKPLLTALLPRPADARPEDKFDDDEPGARAGVVQRNITVVQGQMYALRVVGTAGSRAKMFVRDVYKDEDVVWEAGPEIYPSRKYRDGKSTTATFIASSTRVDVGVLFMGPKPGDKMFLTLIELLPATMTDLDGSCPLKPLARVTQCESLIKRWRKHILGKDAHKLHQIALNEPGPTFPAQRARVTLRQGQTDMGLTSDSYLALTRKNDTPELLQNVVPEDVTVTCVVWLKDRTPTNMLLAVGDELHLWNIRFMECTQKITQTDDEDKADFECCDVSTDGNWYVTGDAAGIVKHWDAKTGKLKCKCRGHDGAISSVAAWKPDIVVSGSSDRTIKLWKFGDDSCISTLAGHANGVTCMLWVDGVNPLLITGSEDWSVKIWEVIVVEERKETTASTLCTGTITKAHRDTVKCLCQVGYPCKKLVTGTLKEIKVWSFKTLECLATLAGHEGWVNGLAYYGEPAKLLLSSSSDRTIRCWSIEDGEQARELKTVIAEREPNLACFAFGAHKASGDTMGAKNTPTIATGIQDGEVKIWALDSEAVKSLEKHQAKVTSVAIVEAERRYYMDQQEYLRVAVGPTTLAPARGIEDDKNQLRPMRTVSGSADGVMKLWDMQTGLSIKSMERHAHGLAITCIITAFMAPPMKLEMEVSAEEIQQQMGHADTADFDPNASTASTAGGSKYGTIIDPSTIAVKGAKAPPVLSAAAVPMEQQKLKKGLGTRESMLVSKSEPETSKKAGKKAARKAAKGGGSSSKGGGGGDAGHKKKKAKKMRMVIASGSADCTVRLWSGDGGHIRVLRGHTAPITALCILDPEGQSVAADHAQRRAEEAAAAHIAERARRKLAKGKKVPVEPPPPAGPQPRGSHYLISASADSTLRCWEMCTGHCLNVFRGHTASVLCVGVLPSGLATAPMALLVSGSADHTIRVWDVSSGYCDKIMRTPQRVTKLAIRKGCITVPQLDKDTAAAKEKAIVDARALWWRGSLRQGRGPQAMRMVDVGEVPPDLTLKVQQQLRTLNEPDLEARLVFKKYDQEGCAQAHKGMVSRIEFTRGLIDLGFEAVLSRKETKKLLVYFDRDGMGVIDYKKFLKYFLAEHIEGPSVHKVKEDELQSSLITAAFDQSLKIWDVANAERQDEILQIQLEEERRTQMPGSAIRIQPAYSEKDFTRHREAITCLAVLDVPHPKIATGSADGTIATWDVEQHKFIRILGASDDDPNVLGANDELGGGRGGHVAAIECISVIDKIKTENVVPYYKTDADGQGDPLAGEDEDGGSGGKKKKKKRRRKKKVVPAPEAVLAPASSANATAEAEAEDAEGANKLEVVEQEARVVSASVDGMVVVWAMDSGQILQKLTASMGSSIKCLATLRGPPSIIASGGDDKKVRIWTHSLDLMGYVASRIHHQFHYTVPPKTILALQDALRDSVAAYDEARRKIVDIETVEAMEAEYADEAQEEIERLARLKRARNAERARKGLPPEEEQPEQDEGKEDGEDEEDGEDSEGEEGEEVEEEKVEEVKLVGLDLLESIPDKRVPLNASWLPRAKGADAANQRLRDVMGRPDQSVSGRAVIQPLLLQPTEEIDREYDAYMQPDAEKAWRMGDTRGEGEGVRLLLDQACEAKEIMKEILAPGYADERILWDEKDKIDPGTGEVQTEPEPLGLPEKCPLRWCDGMYDPGLKSSRRIMLKSLYFRSQLPALGEGAGAGYDGIYGGAGTHRNQCGWGGYRQITDACRLAVQCRNCHRMVAAIEHLKKLFTVRRIHNGFRRRPNALGWACVTLVVVVKLSNGTKHLAEIQVQHARLAKAKRLHATDHYHRIRKVVDTMAKQAALTYQNQIEGAIDDGEHWDIVHEGSTHLEQTRRTVESFVLQAIEETEGYHVRRQTQEKRWWKEVEKDESLNPADKTQAEAETEALAEAAGGGLRKGAKEGRKPRYGAMQASPGGGWMERFHCNQVLEGHTGGVTCVAILGSVHEERPMLVSGSRDATIKVWNRHTNKCVTTMIGHRDGVLCIKLLRAPHPWIISGSLDKTLKLWTIKGDCLRSFHGHKDWVTSVEIVGSGEPFAKPMIASCSADRSVRVWEVETGTCTTTFAGHPSPVLQCTTYGAAKPYIISAHGAAPGEPAGTASSGGIRWWGVGDEQCSKVVDEAHEGDVTHLEVFNVDESAGKGKAKAIPGTEMLLTASNDGSCRVLDAWTSGVIDCAGIEYGEGQSEESGGGAEEGMGDGEGDGMSEDGMGGEDGGEGTEEDGDTAVVQCSLFVRAPRRPDDSTDPWSAPGSDGAEDRASAYSISATSGCLRCTQINSTTGALEGQVYEQLMVPEERISVISTDANGRQLVIGTEEGSVFIGARMHTFQ
jgi:WD40 repeat protein